MLRLRTLLPSLVIPGLFAKPRIAAVVVRLSMLGHLPLPWVEGHDLYDQVQYRMVLV